MAADSTIVTLNPTIVTLNPTTADMFVPGRGVWVMAIDNEDGSVGSPAAAIGTAEVDPPF